MQPDVVRKAVLMAVGKTIQALQESVACQYGLVGTQARVLKLCHTATLANKEPVSTRRKGKV